MEAEESIQPNVCTLEQAKEFRSVGMVQFSSHFYDTETGKLVTHQDRGTITKSDHDRFVAAYNIDELKAMMPTFSAEEAAEFENFQADEKTDALVTGVFENANQLADMILFLINKGAIVVKGKDAPLTK
jgi:hypothetical protein